MEFDAWVEKFKILKDGEYLGFSNPVEPEELLPIELDIDIETDSEFIWIHMRIDQSLIWSKFLDDKIYTISNGFEPNAVCYYIAREGCNKRAQKVKFKA